MIWQLLGLASIVVSVVAVLRECFGRKVDGRFEGDKLDLRS